MNYFDLLRLLKLAHKHKHKINQKWQRGAEREHKISCPRCHAAHCCHQFVATSIFEGGMIANLLIQTGQKEMMKQITEQGKEQGQIMKDLGFDTQEPRAGIENWQRVANQISEIWFERHTPCAFLTNERRCAVYGVRPTACATYLAICEPDQCGGPVGTLVPTVNNSQPVAATLALDADVIAGVMGYKEAPIVAPVPLGTAVYLGMLLLTSGPQALAAVEAGRVDL